MKKTNQGLTTALVILFAASTQVFAIEGLKLIIRCPDVVLSWPSVEGENYIVEHRETLQTNTPWATLTNYMPAESGTNLTMFVHTNRVDCPAGQVFGMMHSAGGGGETLSALTTTLSVEERIQLKQAREEARLSALYEQCKLEDREPYDWELKNQPPLPLSGEEVRARILKARAIKATMLSGASIEGVTLEGITGPGDTNGPEPEGDGSEPGAGFYRVVRTGVHMWGMTNDMAVSGKVSVPIEVGLLDSGELSFVSLTSDGNSIFAADTFTAPFPPALIFELDTTYLHNGTHTLQAEAAWVSDNGGIPNSSAWTPYYSDPITVNVSNAIAFPDWNPFFGDDLMFFSIEMAQQNVYFEMDLFGTNGNYIVTLAGTTTNGIIEFAWDFTDFTNAVHQDDSFTGTVYAFSDIDTNALPLPPNRRRKDNWPVKGDWIVVNQKAWSGHSGAALLDTMADNWVGYAHAHGYQVRPVNPDDSSMAFRLRVNTFATNDWAQLRTALTNFNSRNLYYFGHGSPNSIGGYTGTSAVGLTAEQIRELLFQLWNRNYPTLLHTNHHDYRFVFIDGCESATGNPGLPSTFGIYANQEQGLEKYVAIRPSAFVGWTAQKVISVANSIQTYHPNFVGWFLYEWGFQGRELRDAIDRGAAYPGTTGINISTLKIRGYGRLKFDEYNYQ